jgi:hypothetical protein
VILLAILDVKFLLLEILDTGILSYLLEGILGTEFLGCKFLLQLFSLLLHKSSSPLLWVEGGGLVGDRLLDRGLIMARCVQYAAILGRRWSLVNTRWRGRRLIYVGATHHNVQIWLLCQRCLNRPVKVRIIRVFGWDFLCLLNWSWPFSI